LLNAPAMQKLGVLALALAACTGAASDPSADDDDDPHPPATDDGFNDPTPPADDGYVPKAMTASRFGVFYQISRDVLDVYQDAAQGLPMTDNHAWLITHSHATAFASRALADLVHRRSDFYYAPAFDLWDASHDGWQTASDAKLAQWGHEFRDAAITAHADLFTFNECPSTTGSNANVRVRVAKILRAIHEPDAKGRQLFGVVYFTEKAATPSSWTSAGSDFFSAIDDTSIALVAEHYHSTGFVCSLSDAALADHLFAMRKWLVNSGETAKVSIANAKFTVLHSSRFESGQSGWAGGDSTKTTLADFQRDLSRAAQITRVTEGGYNRLAFGPTQSALTQIGVQPRITELFRWHYLHTAPQLAEQPCVAGADVNCACH
jgi:hypothetical protein